MRARTSIFLLASFCLVGSAFSPAPVGGQGNPPPPAGFDSKPIGKVMTVSGSVTIEHAAGIVVQANVSGSGSQTKADDPVYRGDIVQTGADGSVGIIFGDGTSFNVSKNARMEINEFIYDPKGTSNSTLFSLTKGTFTMLAGKTAKTGNMRVETPVGTMGIRGTAPHVEISDDGTVKFSTLVEENKNTAAAQPPAKPAPPPARQQPAEKPLPYLNICRNC
jgi:hypothetical protein